MTQEFLNAHCYLFLTGFFILLIIGLGISISIIGNTNYEE